MPIDILMPALSPTMEKGNLAKWVKKEGDKVSPGDVLAEIETDKATMEVEAVDEGTLAKIVIPAGTNDVPVNQLIGVLATEGEDVAAAASQSGAAKAQQLAKTEAPKEQPATAKAQPDLSKPATAESKPAKKPAADAPARSGGGRMFVSPLARRMAKEAQIDLARVIGSGPHGRIVARDVEAAKSGKGMQPAAAASAGPAMAQGLSDDKIPALFEPGSYEIVAHDGMRKTIAQRLTLSKQTVPHFYLTVDCVIDALLKAREEINAGAPKDKDKQPAFKISVNDFIIKALAVALQRIPDANVTWTEGGLLKHTHSDVGVAVAIPGGLITPIVRKAEQKPLSVISNEMKDYASRARARKLKPDEYQGGTTAVSNLGMFGIRDFYAVINPPHATILAVGAGEERAIVRNGKIEVANVMTCTLAVDHRAVDGALGAQLLATFKKLIENPVMMIV